MWAGSYPESESQLSQIALRWMLCEAERAGLQVDPQRKAEVLNGKLPYVLPDPHTKNQHESLRGGWWIAELWPKEVHLQTNKGEWYNSIRLNFGRRRWMSPDSLIHESVKQRLGDASLHYKPTNLPEGCCVIEDDCSSKPLTK